MTTSPLTTLRSPALFWGAWVVASVVAQVLGVFVAITVGFGLGEIVANAAGETAGAIVVGLGFGLGTGAMFSAAQWLVLRTRLPGSAGYAWGGALGSVAAFMLMMPFAIGGLAPSGRVPLVLALGAAAGLAMGAAQWLALRGKAPAAWMAVSAVSMAVSLALLFALSGEGREMLTAVVSGLAHGALSGAGMLWVLRRE